MYVRGLESREMIYILYAIQDGIQALHPTEKNLPFHYNSSYSIIVISRIYSAFPEVSKVEVSSCNSYVCNIMC